MTPSTPHRDSSLPQGTRRILHLDVDAFLASVEVALHPELRGLPVVVGGSPKSRNLVMSCSYEARDFGIWPGMSLAAAQRKCPRAVFRDGDSQAANRLREQVTRILLGFTPKVEVTSIDDFFLDLTGTARLHGAACDAACKIQCEVRERVRLPLSIGIACNRLLARLAGKLAKPGGVAELLPGHEAAFLHNLPVGQMPGVGHAIGSKLERFAIRTVGDLLLVPREVLFASFGRDGLLLHGRARGLDETPVQASHYEDESGQLIARPQKSIHRDSTFEPEEGRTEVIEAMLSYLVERACARLRAARSCVKSLEVRIRYVDTRAAGERRQGGPLEGLAATRRCAFRAPTDSTDEIWRQALGILRGFPRRRALVKRIGISMHALSTTGGWQGRLFDEADAGIEGHPAQARGSHADRQRRIDQALDKLRDQMGFGRIMRGSSTPLANTHPLGREGYQLRTPSLNQ